MLGILLIGRNTDMGFWEVFQIARRRREKVRRVSERFVLVQSNDLSAYARLAYARVVGIMRGAFRRRTDIPRIVNDSGLRREIAYVGSFFVRAYPKSRSVERAVGWWLDGRPNARTHNVVRVVYAAGRWYVLYPSVEIDASNFRERDAKNRPFFHPTGMNAREARALVNMSAVMPGETFLDPFCGTGALVIEAALLGARAIGIDADPTMVEGARRNAAYFGVSATFILGDARNIPFPSDAIATDLPYGRSSRVFGGELRELYEQAFVGMRNSLRKGFCVVVTAQDVSEMLEQAGFYVDHVCKWYVHKALTRRVHICHV